MSARRSTRSFDSRAVGLDALKAILGTAALAPSNSNTQPWQVHALTGAAKDALSAALLAACGAGHAPAFSHFPATLPPRMAEHQGDFGARYYDTLDIDRADAEARAAQTLRNYEFFGAPVGLILTVHRDLLPHSWLDCGLFLQSLLLAACSHGLGACAQVSFARFDELIRRQLALPDDERVVCGVALGHATPDALVNRMQQPRRPVSDVATFRGWESSDPVI